VIGFDPDPKALARAARKVHQAKVSVQLDQGFSNELPYPDAFFDRILSSCMFHHVEPGQRAATMREVRRTLKPGGELHLMDFGGPAAEPKGFLIRLVHSHHLLQENFGNRIPLLMAQAGLTDSREVFHRQTFFGQTAYYRATAPAL
jgi:ubiquinone/menaquinone biosynthesis C-methylase UbiE